MKNISCSPIIVDGGAKCFAGLTTSLSPKRPRGFCLSACARNAGSLSRMQMKGCSICKTCSAGTAGPQAGHLHKNSRYRKKRFSTTFLYLGAACKRHPFLRENALPKKNVETGNRPVSFLCRYRRESCHGKMFLPSAMSHVLLIRKTKRAMPGTATDRRGGGKGGRAQHSPRHTRNAADSFHAKSIPILLLSLSEVNTLIAKIGLIRFTGFFGWVFAQLVELYYFYSVTRNPAVIRRWWRDITIFTRND